MKTLLHLTNWPTALPPLQQNGFDSIWESARRLPFFYWPEKSRKAREQGYRNAKKLKKQCGLQSVWNVWLDQELRERGFSPEVQVRPEVVDDNQRVDHALVVEDGKLLCCESEFGNSSHIESNYLKFIDAFNWGRAAMGVMICPTARTAAVTTGGCITFESAVLRLSKYHPSTLQLPVAIIGVDHEHPHQVDLSETLLEHPEDLSGNGDKALIWHVVSELRAGVAVDTIGRPGHAESQQAARERKRTQVAAQPALF